MSRCITIIKITTRRNFVVTIIARNISGVMVVVICIVTRYIIIFGTNRYVIIVGNNIVWKYGRKTPISFSLRKYVENPCNGSQ